MSYQNVATGGNSSTFPGIHNGWNFPTSTVDITTQTNLTANTSATDYTSVVLAGDYRRIRALNLRLRVIVNTSGSSGRVAIKVFPKGGAAATIHFFTLDAASVTAGSTYDQNITVPVDSDGIITWQMFVTGAVSWDITASITQWGVLL